MEHCARARPNPHRDKALFAMKVVKDAETMCLSKEFPLDLFEAPFAVYTKVIDLGLGDFLCKYV